VFVAHLRVGEKRAADCIEDYLDEEITLQWLADVAEVDRYHFITVSKQPLGVTRTVLT
jgi:hypothetical protein